MRFIRDKDLFIAGTSYLSRRSNIKKRKRRLESLLREDIRNSRIHRVGTRSSSIKQPPKRNPSSSCSRLASTIPRKELAMSFPDREQRHRQAKNKQSDVKNAQTVLTQHEIDEIARLKEEGEMSVFMIASLLDRDTEAVRKVYHELDDLKEPEEPQDQKRASLDEMTEQVLGDEASKAETSKSRSTTRTKKHHSDDDSSTDQESENTKTVRKRNAVDADLTSPEENGKGKKARNRETLEQLIVKLKVHRLKEALSKMDTASETSVHKDVTPTSDNQSGSNESATDDPLTPPIDIFYGQSSSDDGEETNLIDNPALTLVDVLHDEVERRPANPEQNSAPNGNTRLFFAPRSEEKLSRKEMSRWIDPKKLSRFNPDL